MCWEIDYEFFSEQKKAQETRTKQEQRRLQERHGQHVGGEVRPEIHVADCRKTRQTDERKRHQRRDCNGDQDRQKFGRRE